MIEGIIIKELKQIIDARGKVMHMLRCDSPIFTKFGEIYFSSATFIGVVAAVSSMIWNWNYFPDSIYSTIFSAIVFTTRSNSASSLSSNVIRKPGNGVKNDVNGTTQIPVAAKR